MKVYLAGPMTGLPQFNYPAFHAEAQRLRALGYEVANPAENELPPKSSWLAYMRVAIKQLVDCDAVAMLSGWQMSRGARIEYTLALLLGMWLFKAEDLQGRDESCTAC